MKNDDQLKNPKANFEEEKLARIKKENPELYKAAREKGTEAPYSGKYVNETSKGMYKCAVCGQVLFDSKTKFSSDGQIGLEGWPSFEEALPGTVEYVEDNSYGMRRTEAVCSRCKSHLGHLFDDPTTKTGKHLCINSVCLDLEKEK